MSDYTLNPPILAAILCNAPLSSFSAPPPDNYCTVPKTNLRALNIQNGFHGFSKDVRLAQQKPSIYAR